MSVMSEQRTETHRLLERRAKEAASLPPFWEIVRGSILTRYRRCGKPTCHCARTKGHGPAHYLQVALNGKTQQILLSEEMLPVAQSWVDNYQRWWEALEKVSEVNRRLLRLRAAELSGEPERAGKKSGRVQGHGKAGSLGKESGARRKERGRRVGG